MRNEEEREAYTKKRGRQDESNDDRAGNTQKKYG